MLAPMAPALKNHLSPAAPAPFHTMDRNLALESVRVTEAAALAAALEIGRGDEKMVDHVAVESMRETLGTLAIAGTVVIGEGERDDAPMLYIGEEVGTGDGPVVDIALDPVEGTTIVARGGQNALAVLAMADAGSFLNAPDVYMQKLATGADVVLSPEDLDLPTSEILRKVASAKRKEIGEVMVCILDRPRHQQLIAEVREAGARITLIGDGDVSGVIATAEAERGIDVYIGTGGAPEGVLAAAALQCIGGSMVGRLVFRNDGERVRAEKSGIRDFSRIYTLDDLAKGNNLMFAATGITDGTMLPGVKLFAGGAVTHSVVMRSKSGTVRRIESRHNFLRKQF
jgi:fructose-1,6-bisphosphatase II / sedoheptulose-1,7-bisphosphatase